MASSHDREGQKNIRLSAEVVRKLLPVKHAFELRAGRDMSWESFLSLLADEHNERNGA